MAACLGSWSCLKRLQHGFLAETRLTCLGTSLSQFSMVCHAQVAFAEKRSTMLPPSCCSVAMVPFFLICILCASFLKQRTFEKVPQSFSSNCLLAELSVAPVVVFTTAP